MSKVPGQLSALCDAFRLKSGATLVQGSETITESQIRFNLRVASGHDTTRWLALVERFYTTAKDARWKTDVSKQYFLGPDGVLRYGWRVILQGTALSEDLESIINGVRGITVAVQGRQLDEVPLHGSPNRSKGAGLYGTVPIGPLVRG